jgi:hypothetical protein
MHFEGYWQSPRYFEAIGPRLLDEFRPSTPMSSQTLALHSRIKNERSLCVNVRRGDFVSNPKSNRFHGVLSASYYSHAVEVVKRKYKIDDIFVFSDDPAWCKQNLNLGRAFEIVGHEHAGPHFSHYLELMKASSAFVIPNSTFGWWGAWLSGESGEIVVAPKAWFRNPQMRMGDLIPAGWIRV